VSAARLNITGIVQGVGFRPFVRRLALQLDLPGWVRNTADGVCILIPDNAADLFQQQIVADHPRLARIDDIVIENCKDKVSHPFEIRPSATGDVTTGVAPDQPVLHQTLRSVLIALPNLTTRQTGAMGIRF